METPDTIRQKIDQLICAKDGVDYASVSVALGKNSAYIHQYLSKKSPRVLSDTQRRIVAGILGVDEKELMTDEQKNQEKRISIIEKTTASLNTVSIDVLDAKACCGNGINNFSEKIVGSYLMSEQDVKRLTSTTPDNLKIIKTIGESMLPTIKPGEFVLIDLSCKIPTSDGLYVLRNGEDLVVRRIQIDPVNNSIEVISDNKTYKSKFYPDFKTVSVIGRVLFHMKIEQTF